MNDAQVLEKLSQIFRDVFDDDEIALTRATTAADVPDWDSFNHINILVATEATFGVKFQTAEIEQLKNVGELMDVLQQKLGSDRGMRR